MSPFCIECSANGIFFPRLQLWLDPHRAQTGPELVFVSHAHSDHIGRHREVILTAATDRLMQARLSGERLKHLCAFGEVRSFHGSECPFTITLLPAGHILGSAMAFITAGTESLLYTGDFQTRPHPIAEHCEPCHADFLIMETTFGRPLYTMPPAGTVWQQIVQFCRETLEANCVPVLLGYSLGKSQELLAGLASTGLPLMVHREIDKMTRIHKALGCQLPNYEVYDEELAAGKVVILPPGARLPEAASREIRCRTAAVTGWAMDSGTRYRLGTDAAFPLSDHADFPALIDFAKQVAPRKVYTVHGFAADFAWTLRDLGFDAQALGEEEQLTLALAGTA